MMAALLVPAFAEAEDDVQPTIVNVVNENEGAVGTDASAATQESETQQEAAATQESQQESAAAPGESA